MVCKSVVETTRAAGKTQALQLGVKEEELATGEARVCNTCWCKTLKKKHSAVCPMPTCTSNKGRKITRKISQLECEPGTSKGKKEEEVNWSEDAIEKAKGSLRQYGTNWTKMAEAVRDKPSLISDEQSGSSTSSGEEDVDRNDSFESTDTTGSSEAKDSSKRSESKSVREVKEQDEEGLGLDLEERAHGWERPPGGRLCGGSDKDEEKGKGKKKNKDQSESEEDEEKRENKDGKDPSEHKKIPATRDSLGSWQGYSSNSADKYVNPVGRTLVEGQTDGSDQITAIFKKDREEEEAVAQVIWNEVTEEMREEVVAELADEMTEAHREKARQLAITKCSERGEEIHRMFWERENAKRKAAEEAAAAEEQAATEKAAEETQPANLPGYVSIKEARAAEETRKSVAAAEEEMLRAAEEERWRFEEEDRRGFEEEERKRAEEEEERRREQEKRRKAEEEEERKRLEEEEQLREQEWSRGQEEERRRQERKEIEDWTNYKKVEAEMDLKLRLQNEARVWRSEDEKLWRQREQLKREEEIEREVEAQGPESIEQKQADDDFNPVVETMAVRAQRDAKNKASPRPKLIVLPWQKVDPENEKRKHQEKLAKELQKMQLQQTESKRSDKPTKKKKGQKGAVAKSIPKTVCNIMKLKSISKTLDRNLYSYISQVNDGPPKKREPLIKKVFV